MRQNQLSVSKFLAITQGQIKMENPRHSATILLTNLRIMRQQDNNKYQTMKITVAGYWILFMFPGHRGALFLIFLMKKTLKF